MEAMRDYQMGKMGYLVERDVPIPFAVVSLHYDR